MYNTKLTRIICFIISIILCFGLFACSDDQPKETGQNIPVEPSLNERVFLNVQTMGGESTNGFVNSTVYGIDTSQNMETFEELKNTVKKLPFDDEKEFVYEYSQCAYKTSKSQEYGTFYSVYDVYSNGKERIMHLSGTDLLCFYTSSEPLEGMTVEAKSKEEAKDIADNFLLQFLTQEELNNYTDVNVDDTDNLFSYYIRYTREIEGYKTDEELWLSFNKDGFLRGYVGYNLKKYDNLLDRISKEKLDDAKEALLDKLSASEKTDFSYEDPRITTDTSGNLYLEVKYSYTSESGAIKVEIALVSIN